MKLSDYGKVMKAASQIDKMITDDHSVIDCSECPVKAGCWASDVPMCPYVVLYRFATFKEENA